MHRVHKPSTQRKGQSARALLRWRFPQCHDRDSVLDAHVKHDRDGCVQIRQAETMDHQSESWVCQAVDEL